MSPLGQISELPHPWYPTPEQGQGAAPPEGRLAALLTVLKPLHVPPALRTPDPRLCVPGPPLECAPSGTRSTVGLSGSLVAPHHLAPVQTCFFLKMPTRELPEPGLHGRKTQPPAP